jgi:hypothetical protein
MVANYGVKQHAINDTISDINNANVAFALLDGKMTLMENKMSLPKLEVDFGQKTSRSTRETDSKSDTRNLIDEEVSNPENNGFEAEMDSMSIYYTEEHETLDYTDPRDYPDTDFERN